MKSQNATRENFHAIFEATPSPYLILEPDAPRFTIIAVNDAYTEITNTVRENIIGKGLFEVFPDNPEDSAATGVTNLTASLMKVLETKKIHNMAVQRYDIPIQDGTAFEMRFWSPQNVPVLDEDGKVSCIVHSVFDVTEKVLLEKREISVLEKLKNANLNLSKSNKELERFAFVVTHDLEEPIRKISTFGNLVKKRLSPALNKDEIDFLNRLLSASERVRILIIDVLAYYMTPYSNQNFGLVDLNLLIKKVLHDMDKIVTEKKAVVDVQKLYCVPGNQMQLKQMFENLLNNSLKFSKPAVEPHIAISCKIITWEESNIKKPEAPLNKKFQQIEISDNGIGFEQEYAEKIFGVFERLHGYDVYAGSGIGLSVVKKIVENHHGKIRAEGELNKGAIFKILLPLRDL